jgi:hypothetical protein
LRSVYESDRSGGAYPSKLNLRGDTLLFAVAVEVFAANASRIGQ